MAERERQDSFLGFLTETPGKVSDSNLDRRMENLERKIEKILAIEEKLDKVLSENEYFRKEIYLLTTENSKLLREKVELEKVNVSLGRQCEEMKEKMVELERKLREGEVKGDEMNEKLTEVMSHNEAAHVSFKEIIKQQENERRQIAQQEVVKVLQKEEVLVRNIAEKKKCVVVNGLKEENIRNWQERKEKEEEKVQSLLSKVLGDEGAAGVVEDHLRLGKYEEGKTRPVKITLKSQADAESLLRNAWKLKNSQETNTIYVRRNMSQEERAKMRELVAQVKEKNEQRTEEEKKEFFWKVRHDRLWKWWIKERV